MNSNELESLTKKLLSEEDKIEQDFNEAWKSLPDDEKELAGGFHSYGLGNKMYSLRIIAMNLGIISRQDLDL